MLLQEGASVGGGLLLGVVRDVLASLARGAVGSLADPPPPALAAVPRQVGGAAERLDRGPGFLVGRGRGHGADGVRPLLAGALAGDGPGVAQLRVARPRVPAAATVRSASCPATVRISRSARSRARCQSPAVADDQVRVVGGGGREVPDAGGELVGQFVGEGVEPGADLRGALGVRLGPRRVAQLRDVGGERVGVEVTSHADNLVTRTRSRQLSYPNRFGSAPWPQPAVSHPNLGDRPKGLLSARRGAGSRFPFPPAAVQLYAGWGGQI